MSHDNDRWYVVRSKPKQEVRVERNLQAWGVPTLLPKTRELRASQRSLRTQARVAPLFPSYVFARFDAPVQLAKVRMTRGVQDVISFGEHAAIVDESVIALIESRIGEDGYVRIAGPEVGDRVEIVSGPFRSFVGVFERSLSARERVLILLTTIGGGTRVNLAKTQIQRYGASRYAVVTGR